MIPSVLLKLVFEGSWFRRLTHCGEDGSESELVLSVHRR